MASTSPSKSVPPMKLRICRVFELRPMFTPPIPPSTLLPRGTSRPSLRNAASPALLTLSRFAVSPLRLSWWLLRCNTPASPVSPQRGRALELNVEMGTPTFRESVSDAIRFWEPRRLVYNALLSVIVLFYFFRAYPASKAVLTLDSILGLFLLAVLANVAYCSAYVADAFAQWSSYRDLWR